MISAVELDTLLDEEDLAADDEQADFPIPQWHIDELRRRKAAYDKNPVGAVTWEELKKRILGESCSNR